MRKITLFLAIISVSLASWAMVGFSAPALAESDDHISVQNIPGPTIGQKLRERAQISWPWYIIRGSGMVAAVALIVLLLSGIGQVTGLTFKFLEPLTAWATHRTLGITFGVAVLVHMFGLLFDHFVSFNIWQILVPWLSHYRPVSIAGVHLGSLWVATGVLAFYGTILVILTSLLWVDKKPLLWKLTHLLSYIIMVFVFVHALYLGTDLAHGWLRWTWLLLAAVMSVAFLRRLWRAWTI